MKNEKMKETKDCTAHTWIPLLGFDKAKIVVPTALFTCLRCGDLKVGTETIKISRFRLDMGDLPIKSVSTVGIKEPLAVDHTASGIIVSMTAGENLVFGNIVYFKSGGKCWKANATSGSAAYPAMGMAIASISADAAGDILLHGTARDDSWATLTVGGVIYLSKTAGAIIQSYAGYTTDEVIQVLGIATNATRMYFNPSPDYLTHT
ncbi:MAG: hypothetical protein Q7R79_02365 [bacterium]|nr:hypothetical protein [bacterium]